MFVTIINDCKDDNAKGRQETRIQSLTGHPISYVAVDSDLHAGMQLVDMLDAAEGREGLILVNCAPRGGSGKKWPNGTPFAFFGVGKTIVVSTIDGYALSGVKKLGLIDGVKLLDTKKATDALLAAGIISEQEAAYIPESQFRSFDFSPRIGVHLLQGNELPAETYEDCSLDDVPELPSAVWHIDSFGNCKTTLTLEQINTESTTSTHFGDLPYFAHLHDVPQDAHALVRGSSGYKETRFVELMAQGQPFAKVHNVSIGDSIFGDEHFGESAT